MGIIREKVPLFCFAEPSDGRICASIRRLPRRYAPSRCKYSAAKATFSIFMHYQLAEKYLTSFYLLFIFSRY